MSSNRRGNSRSGKTKANDHGNGWEEFGGYMAAKRKKLNDQFMANKPMEADRDGETSDIFKGIVIHVNGYTKPSSDELKRLMMLHGGAYEHFMSKTHVTHVIATSLASSKVKEFKHMKLIRPEWITDSVKSGRLLSYVPYQLYTAQTGIQKGLSSFTMQNVTQCSTISNNTQHQAADMTTSFRPNDLTQNHIDKYNCGSESLMENPAPLVTKADEGILSDSTIIDRSIQAIDNSYNIPNVGEYTMQETGKVNLSTTTTAAAATSCKSSHSPAKAGDPDFLSEFYSNSRLHHLSTWKSEWRSYVNKLQKQGNSFPGRQKLHDLVKEKEMEVCQRVVSPLPKGKPQRVIMHIDMDCFFVSVGLKKRPELRGKPVVVTHSRGKGVAKDTPGSDVQFERKQWELKKRQQGGKKGKRKLSTVSDHQTTEDNDEEESDDVEVEDVARQQTSPSDSGSTFHSMAEIASCSYEARKLGVRNGMFMGKAKQLCPDLVTIPYDFEGYQEVSKILYDTVASYTHDIEAVSCDEMLVDCTDLLNVTGSNPLQFASILREEIYTKTRCTASAGMGSNILLAKMATKKAKPNGQYYVDAGEVLGFIYDQSIDNIPGVGWSMSRKLHDMKVKTCGDLQKVAMSTLQSEFGNKTGQSLYKYCRGQDDRPIKMEQERKSVSAEINYGIRLKNDMEAEQFLTELSEEVHNRLVNIDMKGKSITLKIMSRRADAPQETAKFMGHGICNNTSKSVMLPIATDDSKIISRECISILRNLKVKAIDLRGIGIQVQKLEPSTVRNNNVKGAQSILNFAVPKSKDKVISPPGNYNTSPFSDKRIIDRKSPKHDNTTVLQPRDCQVLPPFDSPQTDEDHVSHNSVDVTESNNYNQEINGNNEEELHGIVGELARRKTAKKILPPLPSMDDLSLTPEGAETLTSSGRPRRSKHPVKPSEDYFPSPSQIDPEVLKELPSEVRKQIENEIKTRQKKKNDRSSISLESERRPGCSHWSDSQSGSTNQTLSGSTNQSSSKTLISTNEINDVIVPLPSPSQLDESCLNALPDDLQKELREAYAQQTEHERNKTAAKTTSMWLHQNKSPSKKPTSPLKTKSPGKAKKNSPVFKVPQGRPVRGRKKLSPKKLNFQKQPKIDSAVSGKKESVPMAMFDTEETASSSKQIPVTPVTTRYVDQTHQNKVQKPINLCGAVSIADVKILLREWLQSSTTPEIDDEEIMIEYLTELVFDHNLEQVDLVLKFLNRNICKMDRVNWRSSLIKIINAVQVVVQSMYGCQLALPADFDVPVVI